MAFRPRVAIDLGTVNTLVAVNGRGVVVDEPSAVAIDRATGRVAAVGLPAEALAGKEPEDVEVIAPLRHGVVADIDATAVMLHTFLRRAKVRQLLARPHVLVCVPAGATWVERQSVPAALRTRGRGCVVTLLDEPVAAAAGAGVNLSSGEGAFVMNVGGGRTEVAVVSGGRVARTQSLRLGGNDMDEAIVHAAKSELGLLLGIKAARRLKMTLGLTGGEAGYAEVVGVDAGSRTPRVENIQGKLVATALEPAITAIIDAMHEMQSDLPPDLAEDVVRGKIRLAGGGALLPGLAERIEASAGIPTAVADDPLRCAIRGAVEILEHGGGPVTEKVA
ncbi:MAG TPA: rod shape-determining protein [Streptosporangiaceae bacterium]|nr:rod shape-determining protein [Streptosporangiaceae bacterium]